MKHSRCLPIILLLGLLFVLSACSGGKTPVEPGTESLDYTQDMPESFGTSSDSRNVIAAYDAVIDPDAGTFEITPAERSTQYHFPLTQLYPNVLQITGFGWTPNFWADIKLQHPLPGSGIDAFDPRVIAILPANPSVRFIYPALGVGGNNQVVLEPDGYTKLFDELGGAILGNVNPFRAYFKDQPYRRWSSTVATEETQRWQMDITGFSGPLQFKLVVDVSTNFPAPPRLGMDNAPEPVKIEAEVGPGLTSDGESADINVILLGWKGQMTIGGVIIEAPELFNGTTNLAYSASGPNPNEYVYTGTISNSLLAPEGEYNYLVATWDQATGIYLYDEFSADVINDGGYLIWAKRAGGSNSDFGFAITSLLDNSTVVTGTFSISATFGRGEPNEIRLISAHQSDIFIARYNPDGTLAWAKRAGGTGYDRGNAITNLSDDSTVVTGFYETNATFGPGEPNQTVLTTQAYAATFIARYNPDGTLAWAKDMGVTNFKNYVYGITTLSDNSTVVSGEFYSTATFGLGEPNETILTADGVHYFDIFIAQYNSDGTLAWAKRAGGTGSDSGQAITTLSDDSTVVSGSFSNSATFGPDEPNETVLISLSEYSDIFIAHYNPDGTLAWAKRAGGTSGESCKAITTLSDNSTVINGFFRNTATFGLGEPNETTLIADDERDIFISRYNPDGTLAWAKRAGGRDDDVGDAITTLSDNSFVITGYFERTATFGPGELNETVLTAPNSYTDIFIVRYNPNGTLAWAKRAGGSNSDYGCAITSLSDNSTVVTGDYHGPSTFGPGEPNETVLTSVLSDIFIARFEP